MAKRVSAYFDANHDYDLIYCQIPPNDVTLAAGRAAKRYGIPFVVDVNDLWPEAFRIALDVPVVSDLLFAPFERQARRAYALADAVVGTSDEYAARPFRDRAEDIPKLVVYVGNDLAEFDAGAAENAASVVKPAGEVWVSYAGNISALYDLETLVEAVAIAAKAHPELKLKILGDGPERGSVEAAVMRTGAPAELLGYMPYRHHGRLAQGVRHGGELAGGQRAAERAHQDWRLPCLGPSHGQHVHERGVPREGGA